MSSDSIFTSIVSEGTWVLALDKIFLQPQTFESESTYCSVFRVSTNLTEEKPEDYAPHHLGLGPYHHIRPDIYKTLPQKLKAIRKYLGPKYNSKSFQLVVDALISLEANIRASYDRYLDLRIATLARILAIDGLYLLQFMKYYPRGAKYFAGDIMMLENQIPGFVLEEIQLRLELDPENEEFRSFLRDQSPLDKDIPWWVDVGRGSHLLGCMYDLIVFDERRMAFDLPMMEDVATGVQFLSERGFPGASIAGQILSLVNMIPWSKITGLFKKRGGVEPIPVAKKIDVPSVSEMSKAAGIKFITTSKLSLIKFEESEKEFHLPVIRITTTYEVVLRNLVAYEEAYKEPESTHELAEYLDLMCGIIHNANDVNILKKDKIINSQLGDEEIAHIFNGFSKSTRKSKENSELDKTIDKVNKRYNNLPRVKVKAFFKKYMYGLFKVLGVLISIVVSILLVLQAFCSVFGCTRWFSKSSLGNQATLLSF
ncbi:hypothetical protein ACS0TY_004997 [Phlomoides rotata]